MNWINLQRALHGSNCLSIVMFVSGMYAFWKFSMNGFHSDDARQNLPCIRFSLLSLFWSNRRFFIIFKTLSRGIVWLNKLHLQVALHILFIGKIRTPKIFQAITRLMNLSNSPKLMDHLSFPAIHWSLVIVHFLICHNMGSLKRIL